MTPEPETIRLAVQVVSIALVVWAVVVAINDTRA